MYEQAFNFTTRPFTPAPFVKHYFPNQSINQALQQSCFCIERSSGPVIVIGSTGSGKSLMLQMLYGKFESQFSAVLLDCAHLAARQDLLQSILFELKLPYREMSEGELRLSLIDYLKPSDQSPNGLLLLVDDAHALPADLLDEVRLITNLVRNGESRVRLVMAGTQRLEENLMTSTLDSLNQRIAARCYLQPMNRSETREYIAAHIERANGKCDEIFSDEGLREIHSITEGCPRVINQLCEHSLALAAKLNVTRIEADFVEQAWRDMQNMPGNSALTNTEFTNQDALAAPTTSSPEGKWTVIEFGKLDDDESPTNDSSFENQASDPGESDWPESTSQKSHPTFDTVPDGRPAPREISDDLEPYQPADRNQIWESGQTIKPLDLPTSSSLEWADASFQSNEKFRTDKPDYEYDTESSDTDHLKFSTSEPKQELPPIQWPGSESETADDADGDSFEYRLEPLSLENAPNIEDDCDEESVKSSPFGGADSQVVSSDHENPFDESFEIEESVVDRFMPIFVEQNMSSLTVTKADLEVLNTGDELTCCGGNECGGSTCDSVSEQADADSTTNSESVQSNWPQLEDSFPRETESSHEDDCASQAESSADEDSLADNQSDASTDSAPKRETPITVRGTVDTVSQNEWQDIMKSIEDEQASHIEDSESSSFTMPHDPEFESQESQESQESEESEESETAPSTIEQSEMLVDQEFIERRAEEVLRSLDNMQEQADSIEDESEMRSDSDSSNFEDSAPDLPHSVGPEVTHIALEQLAALRAQKSDVWSDEERARHEAAEQMELKQKLESAFEDSPSATHTSLAPDDSSLTQDDQQVLDDLRNQLDSIHYSSKQQTPGGENAEPEPEPSMAIEFPIGRAADSESMNPGSDDRDMLIVSRSEQRISRPEPEESEPELDSTPASTGRAKRMDYQALFDQLRNISEDE